MAGEKIETGALAGAEVMAPVVPVEKAKVFIVGMVEGVPSVFIPTRSEHEETRIGDSDLPGGKHEPYSEGSNGPRTNAENGLIREVGEEFPGITLEYITHIDTVEKPKDGVPTTTTRIYVAIAKMPKGGIKFGVNEKGKHEHSAIRWEPIAKIPEITDLPKKYRSAAISETGRLALLSLAELAYNIPPESQKAEIELVTSASSEPGS